MNISKKTENFDNLLEASLVRFQQGGFLTGDYVKIKKSALNNDKIKNMSEGFKDRLKTFIESDINIRVSAVKTQRANTSTGIIGGADAPADYYVDIVQEVSPGLWANPMTVPMEIIEKQDFDFFAKTPDSLHRKSKVEKESDDIGADPIANASKDSNLPDKNTKLANANKWQDDKPGGGNTDKLKKPINASVERARVNDEQMLAEKYFEDIYNGVMKEQNFPSSRRVDLTPNGGYEQQNNYNYGAAQQQNYDDPQQQQNQEEETPSLLQKAGKAFLRNADLGVDFGRSNNQTSGSRKNMGSSGGRYGGYYGGQSGNDGKYRQTRRDKGFGASGGVDVMGMARDMFLK